MRDPAARVGHVAIVACSGRVGQGGDRRCVVLNRSFVPCYRRSLTAARRQITITLLLHTNCTSVFPMNRPALRRPRRWVASSALAGYCVVALAGHGLHDLATCEHAPHEVHAVGAEAGIAALHGTELHDFDHCVVCQFCAQAQLPLAQADSFSWQHTGERLVHDAPCLIVPMSRRAYSPRGPPLSRLI